MSVLSAGADWRTRQRLATLGLLGALAAAILGVTALAERFDARRRNAPPEHVLYLPKGDSLKFMCLGYNGIAADMVWIRSVMYVGRKLQTRDQKYEWLEKLYRVTTDLDPHWTRPYHAGALLLSALPQDDARALSLLKSGMANNPWDHQMAFAAAQLNLLRGRRHEALRYLRLMDRCMPDRPAFIPALMSSLSAEGGDYREAVASAAKGLAGTDDRVMREVAARAYRESLARLVAWELSAASAAFAKKKGQAPPSLNELLRLPSVREQFVAKLAPALRSGSGPGAEPARKLLAMLPADPLGMQFQLRPGGAVGSQGLNRLELHRLVTTINGYLKGFEEGHGRPARDLDELLAELEAQGRAGLLPPGARDFFRWPPARLPEHPDGPDGWKHVQFRDGRLAMPPGPTIQEMFSAPLDLPPGPGERQRRQARGED